MVVVMLALPKSLLGDFRMHAGEQKLRRMAVAQIMEAHPRQVRDPRYQPRELVS